MRGQEEEMTTSEKVRNEKVIRRQENGFLMRQREREKESKAAARKRSFDCVS